MRENWVFNPRWLLILASLYSPWWKNRLRNEWHLLLPGTHEFLPHNDDRPNLTMGRLLFLLFHFIIWAQSCDFQPVRSKSGHAVNDLRKLDMICAIFSLARRLQRLMVYNVVRIKCFSSVVAVAAAAAAAAALSWSASCHYNLVITGALGDESPCVCSNRIPWHCQRIKINWFISCLYSSRQPVKNGSS